MPQLEFDKQVAIVTGAGNGLGRSHAHELARRGALVVVNDLGGNLDGSGSGTTAAEIVVQEIEEAGGTAVANYDSVATAQGGENIVQSAIDAFGRVDIIINNAGILRDAAFHKMVPEQVRSVLDVHLLGAFNLCLPAWPYMRANEYGRIVNTSSGAGLFGNFGQANYGAAKMGLVGLTRALAVEGATKGIKVNAIAPVAQTRMTDAVFQKMGIKGDLGPNFITPVVVFLASNSCELSGEVLGCGGGHVNRVFIGETEGLTFAPWFSAEDVDDHIGEIMEESAFTIPPSLTDQMVAMLGKLK